VFVNPEPIGLKNYKLHFWTIVQVSDSRLEWGNY